jgi:hypothetical protein
MVDPMMMNPMMSPDPMQNNKKVQNSTNYKIVKCKNYEKGNLLLIQTELANTEIPAHSLMEKLS